MYSGRMIDELMESVQRAEEHAAVESMTLLKAVENGDGFSTYIYERNEQERQHWQRHAIA